MAKLATLLVAAALFTVGTPALAWTQPKPPSWGLDRIDQRGLPLNEAYQYGFTASTVNVYVIDTGIRTNLASFGGRAKPGFDAVTSGGNADDCHGHGTHVAGTIGATEYGVAKNVQLSAVRVINCNGSANPQQVVDGINWVTANAKKPAVAIAAFTGGSNTAAIDAAVRRAIQSGVTFVTAAGQANRDACDIASIRVAEAITVAATDINDARAPWSNYGRCTDIFAPGVDITSIWNTGETKAFSGTDTAAAHVAGVATLYLSAFPTATPKQVQDALVDMATTRTVTNPGAGSPDRLLFSPCVIKPGPGAMPIPDLAMARSAVTISNPPCPLNQVAFVSVNITHPYRGELKIDLVSQAGVVRTLKPVRLTDAGADVVETYSVGLSQNELAGTWTLQVTDTQSGSTGTLNSWVMYS